MINLTRTFDPRMFANRSALFAVIVIAIAIPGFQANTAAKPLHASSLELEEASATHYPNLFLFKACLAQDPVFCPNGRFDAQAFAQMYLNPELNEQHYPSGGEGPYVRRAVPTCETGDCGEDLVRCTDGTRPVYHYNPGSGADADKWIIRVQGGGSTCGEGDCSLAYNTTDLYDLTSAFGDTKERVRKQGIQSNGPNNLFRNYNLVSMDKCVGDRNLGDNTVTDYPFAPDASGTVYFHGFRIIQAVLQSLKDQPGAAPDLENADTIAFFTTSNGSNGGYLYMDRVRDYILENIAAPGHVPDVRYLASSFIFPNPEVEYALSERGLASAADDVVSGGLAGLDTPNSYKDVYGHVDETVAKNVCGNGFDIDDPSYQDWLDEGKLVDGGSKCRFGVGGDDPRGIGGMFFSTADFNWGREAGDLAVWGASDATPTIDESCYEAHLATGDVEACHDSMHVMLYHLTTPTFFSAQTGDRNLRTARLSSWTTTFDPLHCDQGDPLCHSENFRGDTDLLGNDVPSEGAWRKEDLRLRVLALMYERFNGQSAHQEQPLGNGHGAFVDNVVDHHGLAAISTLRRTMRPAIGADPLELQQYLRRWLDPTNQEPVVCLDDGQLYDAEFAPPVLMEDAPPDLACDDGAYFDPDTSIDPEQRCNDPYDNVASVRFSCLARHDHNVFLPLISSND